MSSSVGLRDPFSSQDTISVYPSFRQSLLSLTVVVAQACNVSADFNFLLDKIISAFR